MVDDNAVPYHHFEKVSFRVFTSKEIKSLSVKEVSNPQTFDALGHATYGGLYDPALGPQERDDVCTTCGLGSLHCPGHMGHISLPLPVYNPVLFRTMFQLLCGVCFNCCRLLIKPAESKLFQCQTKLLNHGLVSESEELSTLYYSMLGEVASGNVSKVLCQLEDFTKSAIDALPDKDSQQTSNVKNVTESRQKLVKEFLAGKHFTSTCVYCKMKKRSLRSEYDAKIFFTDKAIMAKVSLAMKQKKESERRQRLQQLEEMAEYEEVIEENDDEAADEEEPVKIKTSHQYLTPIDLKALLRQVWKNDGKLLKAVIGMFNIDQDDTTCPTDVFFLDIVPVSPSRFRPMIRLKDMALEHQHTHHLSRVLTGAWTIREVLSELKMSDTTEDNTDVQANDITSEKLNAIPGNTTKEKLQNAWVSLQISVNCVYDGEADRFSKDHKKRPGVKQILEKKEGLFRMHMMGKRVNYAARSVISPDPYICTNEIGIPEIFAKTLTYPQPVTPWNFQELKQAVINGPEVHPGAVKVENENGQCVLLKSKDRTQREAIAKQLLTPSVHNKNPGKPKKVYRHLKNGDVMLLNRQPTLHRPSIQAHKVRVLPGQKTLRLHYANCKAFNADFDGDEMNAHFPQNELARSEAYNLALTNYNYLVPKDGTPLAGLLQDHMVSGVLMMIRGRHFIKEHYHQLVFSGLQQHGKRITLVPPCIQKPAVLWSGKQVLTTLLINIIPHGKVLLNIQGSAKVPAKCWAKGKPRTWKCGGSPLIGNDMSESEVVIRQGELLVGVLDKAHYGPASYGLVHCCYELYGPHVAGDLLTGLARLFTCFLQWHGFTLGVEDILVTHKADGHRNKIIKMGRTSGNSAAAKALGVSDLSDEAAIKRKFQEAQFAGDDGDLKDLDLQMKSQTDMIQNDIVQHIMPFGLCKRFPDNNLQLMVQSGAKGSSVNCMQISCLLGQIELEGRRPPLMLSGKQLPSFLPYDTSPRAGGFVDGRFLTGIRPQEYYYHCMAGREGLVDTAVKTSRSGYLQRCIIKHLEGLVVRYDATVRDSDGSVIQFQYGEDSTDILKTPFLKQKQFPFLVSNLNALGTPEMIDEVKQKLRFGEPVILPPHYDCEPKKVQKVIKAFRKRYRKWQKKQGTDVAMRCSPFLTWCKRHFDEILADYPDTGIDKYGHSPAAAEAFSRWLNLRNSEERKTLEKKLKFLTHPPDPFQCVLQPHRHFGCTNERFEDVLEKYLENDPDQLFTSEDGADKASKFRELIYLRYLQSLVQPGEAVGLLAAQSIGEPSTQMTLNTFHFAGRGEMNVTLGIPRLREILMTATASLSTPSMDIPLLNTSHARRKAKLLQKRLTKVYLSQVLEDVEVKEYVTFSGKCGKSRIYKIRFNFLPYDMYRAEYYLTPARILSYMEKMFFTRLSEVIRKHLAELSKSKLLHSHRLQRSKHENEDVDLMESAPQTLDDIDDIVDDDFNDNDAAAAKLREKQQEERDYDGEEEEKEVVGEVDSDVEVEFMGDTEALKVERDSDAEQTEDTVSKEKLKKLKSSQEEKKNVNPQRVREALSHMHMGQDYTYDADSETWCEISLNFPLKSKKLDMLQLVKAEARRAVVTQTPGITRAFLTESRKPGEEGLLRLKTEGINIQDMYNYQDILDLNQLYTNDIHAVARTYGIEAAAQVIIKEIRDVFAAYGISVDYRHLSLISDYMTFEGVYKPFNRIGIESSASSIQKMTFETSMNFLKSATIQGAADDLCSPSARLVVGRLVSGGTGAFEVMQPLAPVKTES